MRRRISLFFMLAIGIVLGLILSQTSAAQAAKNEFATKIAPARPIDAQEKKLNVVVGSTTNLCPTTSTDRRECLILNFSDKSLCLKRNKAGTDCSGVTISAACTAETDIMFLKSGDSFQVTLRTGWTMCGQLETSSAEDCATPASNICVFSAEVQ